MNEQDRSLRTTTTAAEIEPHVFEGELVEDVSGVSTSRLWRRFVNRWQRSSRVPAALKSRQAAKQAGQDATAFALRAPWRFTTTAGRGLLAAVRGWRRWVRVHDYREAAEHSEKLADKFTEIRALTLFRWKVTVAVTITTAVLVAVADLLYGSAALWITGSCSRPRWCSSGVARTDHRDGNRPCPGRGHWLGRWTRNSSSMPCATRN
nr:hypothetical protein [Actinopolyspora mortivallis]